MPQFSNVACSGVVINNVFRWPERAKFPMSDGRNSVIKPYKRAFMDETSLLDDEFGTAWYLYAWAVSWLEIGSFVCMA